MFHAIVNNTFIVMIWLPTISPFIDYVFNFVTANVATFTETILVFSTFFINTIINSYNKFCKFSCGRFSLLCKILLFLFYFFFCPPHIDHIHINDNLLRQLYVVIADNTSFSLKEIENIGKSPLLWRFSYD